MRIITRAATSLVLATGLVLTATPGHAAPATSPAAVSNPTLAPDYRIKVTFNDKTPAVASRLLTTATVTLNGKPAANVRVEFKWHSFADSFELFDGKRLIRRTNAQGKITFASTVRGPQVGVTAYAPDGSSGAFEGHLYVHDGLSTSLPAKKTLKKGQSLKFTAKSDYRWLSEGEPAVLQVYSSTKRRWVDGSAYLAKSPSVGTGKKVCATSQYKKCIKIAPSSSKKLGAVGKAKASIAGLKNRGTYKLRLVGRDSGSGEYELFTRTTTLTVR